jgi:NTP pyrophosphatase (non-canonical NTP hydrolase)/adenylate kinase family enzyme
MLDRYQKEVTKTFKEHGPLDAYQVRMLNWAIGLSGETGEVSEILKHHIFANEKLDKMELAKEIGDVLWYLTAIAETTGINMVDIAELNRSKLNHRYHTGAYTDSEAQTRHSREKLFKDTPIYQVLESRILHKTAPMNVIFIGPDGAGKTTLAKEVAAKMGFKYHKCDYRQENKPALAKQLLDEQINVVYDRFYWPDDALYSTVKGISLPEDYWQEYDAVIDTLQTNNTLFIYVTCDTEELKKRSKAWADDYVTVEMLDAIKNNYVNWLRYVDKTNLRLSTCTMNTTGVKLDSPEFDSLIEGCCQAIIAGQEVYARPNNKEEE